MNLLFISYRGPRWQVRQRKLDLNLYIPGSATISSKALILHKRQS